MTIIRAPRPESNFYLLDKNISEDGRLSWAARGLLVFLLGKPDYWKISIEHLQRQTHDARIRTRRDGVYALLRELEAVGYMRAIQTRSVDGRGFGEVDYLVSEFVPTAKREAEHVSPDDADTPHADTPQTTLVRTESAVRIDNPVDMPTETKIRQSDSQSDSPTTSPTVRQPVRQSATRHSASREAIQFADALANLGYPIAPTYPSLQVFIDEGGDLDHLRSIIGCVEALGPEDAHKKTAEYVIGWGRREMGNGRLAT
ncbi:MAG TPA: hypothetical protein VLC71_09685 [Thermomonas sp.]|nr:hypothetical protein [Thermomonas sp.]